MEKLQVAVAAVVVVAVAVWMGSDMSLWLPVRSAYLYCPEVVGRPGKCSRNKQKVWEEDIWDKTTNIRDWKIEIHQLWKTLHEGENIILWRFLCFGGFFPLCLLEKKWRLWNCCKSSFCLAGCHCQNTKLQNVYQNSKYFKHIHYAILKRIALLWERYFPVVSYLQVGHRWKVHFGEWTSWIDIFHIRKESLKNLNANSFAHLIVILLKTDGLHSFQGHIFTPQNNPHLHFAEIWCSP